jgi:anti-sigma-K factor RskA
MRERPLTAHRRGTLTSWFGYRNIAFIVFIVLLNLYASLAPGSDAAGRVNESAAVTMLWVVVALPFFAVNAVLLGAAFVKERPATKPLIASLLSALSVVVLLID